MKKLVSQAKRPRRSPTRSAPEPVALSVGDVVSAAFEQAFEVTKNQKEAAALASVVVQRLLGRQRRGLFMKRFAAA